MKAPAQVRGKRCRTQLTLEPRGQVSYHTFSTSSHLPTGRTHSKSLLHVKPLGQAISLADTQPACSAPQLRWHHSLNVHSLQMLSGANHILSLPCPSAWPALLLSSWATFWFWPLLPPSPSEQLLNAGLCCSALALRCCWAFSCAESPRSWRSLGFPGGSEG